MTSAIDDQRTTAWLRAMTAGFGLIMLWTTYGLWWPTGDYPVIPWLYINVSLVVDKTLAWLVVGLWGVSLLALGCGWSRVLQAATVTGLLALAGSVCLDQQRLQVWAWEFFWIQFFVSFAAPRAALRSCRLLVLGIYFYSALSKLDIAFTQTQGPWLTEGLSRALGFGSARWDAGTRWPYLLYPVGEFLVATGLAWGRLRRWGIALAVMMHCTLLVSLGPWGWQQRPGVLLWNLYFLATVPVLFWPQSTASSPPEPAAKPWLQRQRWPDTLCLTAAMGLALWPAFEGWNLCDHWPAWAVYSSRPEIVRIDVRESDAAKLPMALQSSVGPAAALSDWRPVSIDQWSFDTRGCPTYPQARYRLAVARSLEVTCGVQLRVTEQSSPDRWTGKRVFREVTDLVSECQTRFWWNTRARTLAQKRSTGPGGILIAITAQLAVACYLLTLLLSGCRKAPQRTAREALVWTLGLLCLTAHTLAAFHYVHQWNHQAALEHTATRTAEVTGWRWSGGLYINYLFLGLWMWDVVLQWLEVSGVRSAVGRRWRMLIHSVFAFMIFNATVVFGPEYWGPLTVAAGVFMASLWLSRTRQPAGKSL